MNMRKLLGALLACLVSLPLLTSQSVQAAGKITLFFFDRDGRQLNIEQIRALSNNGSAGYDNDALLNPRTLEVYAMGILAPSGDTLSMPIPKRPSALALNWPTQTRGYSLIILDNGGKGFSRPGVINFTYQAALETKRRLDISLAKKTAYKASASFNYAYAQASQQLNLANASSHEADKGAHGQLALDQLAVAYDLLLAEYGPQLAHQNLAKQTPWLGLTIDTVDNYQANLDMASRLTQPYGWIRVVFDPGQSPQTYDSLIRYAKSKGLKILGQPVDSSYDKSYSRAQYKQQFIDFLNYYNGQTAPALEAWEVGNEVNGSWLSPEIAKKVADAAREVRKRQPKAQTVLTLFWQINTDSKSTAMFNWAKTKLSPATRKNLDVVLISQYAEQAPMGLAFDQVMNTLKTSFPKQKIGLGELGYWIPDQQFWWAFSQDDPMGAGLEGTAEQYYPAALAYPSSVGGVFWWNAISEFSSHPNLQNTLSQLRDQIQTGP